MLQVRCFGPIVLILAGLLPAQAGPQTISNVGREKNWADQIVDSVVVGEPVWLSARQHKFLALYAPPAVASAAPRLLLHACSLGLVHPFSGEAVEFSSAAPF